MTPPMTEIAKAMVEALGLLLDDFTEQGDYDNYERFKSVICSRKALTHADALVKWCEGMQERQGDINDLEDLIRDAHSYADGVTGNSWGIMASMIQEILNRFLALSNPPKAGE